MKKIIPISVVAATQSNIKMITWKLGNKCNYECHYCLPHNRAGNEKWLSFEQYISIADSYIDLAEKNNKKIWFEITGGEPTVCPKFEDILAHIKNRGHFVAIISNGSRTLRWWEEIQEKNLIDILYLTHHCVSEESSEHTIKVANVFLLAKNRVVIQVPAPCDPTEFNLAYQRMLEIKENTGNIIILKLHFKENKSILDALEHRNFMI
jgi:organic radical activating enzyme